METTIPKHGDVIECYGIEYDVILVMGKQITLRCTQPDKKGKHRTMTVDLDTVIKFINDEFYKLKQKIKTNGTK